MIAREEIIHTGLVSVSFRDRSPEEILAAMGVAGLANVEWGSDVHAPCDDPEKLAMIRFMQEAAGIRCCSYGTYFTFGEQSPEEILPYIQAAKTLGTDILRVWAGTKGSAETGVDEKEQLYADCRAAARIAEEEGVILCAECHNWTLTDTKESALELLRAAGSPAFRMYWQPNQFRSIEENLRYLSAVKEYVTCVHVFYWEGEKHFPLAGGIPVWKQYLKELGGRHTLLLEFMPDDRIESLPAEAEALREIAAAV